MSRIGFYVHHHGRGHLARTRSIVESLNQEAAVLTSIEGVDWDLQIRLPPDNDPTQNEAAAGVALSSSFHFAPICNPRLTQRMAAIAEWAREWKPDLLVVDVSCEIAIFARLCGLPVVVVRQHGSRGDRAHQLAYESAVALLAPYTEELEDPTTADWVRERTVYSGGFSRYDGRSMDVAEARRATNTDPSTRQAVVLAGAGGPGSDLDAVCAAAATTPGWQWTVIGPTRGTEHGRLRCIGWVDDCWPYICGADVVVSGAGDNVVAEVAWAQRANLVIPEERPFAEQHSKAEALAQAGLAIVRWKWPDAVEWPDLLEAAARLSTESQRKFVDGAGAARAAAYLEGLAARFSIPSHEVTLASSTS